MNSVVDIDQFTHALASALAALDVPEAPAAEGLPLRIWVESAENVGGGTAVSGRLLSGKIAAGDGVVISPSNQTAIVDTAGDATDQGISITLTEQFPVQPGEVISSPLQAPVETDVFRVRMSWLSGQVIAAGQSYEAIIHTCRAPVRVQEVLGDSAGVAEVILRTDDLLALDAFTDNPHSGRIVLLDEGAIAGAGIISMEGYADQRGLVTQRATNIKRVEHRIDADARARRFGHRGGVLWLTGLSGSGKSTVAVEAELKLHNMGYNVYVLDGDNVRHGLNANLGFSPEDRAENIRRVGEVAALFSRAGMIVLTAFISPYRSDRDRAREAVPEAFHEIYIDADLETCESRDPKGLYKKARAGEIPEFTGISAPYEAPERAELTIDTGGEDVATSVQHIVDYVESKFALEIT